MPETDHGVKSEAMRIVDSLPEDATWDDLMYRIYVRQCVDAGIADAEVGRVVDVCEVRRRLRVDTVKVVWTETAIAHLVDIYEYIASDSDRYAVRMVDRITIRTQQLSKVPQSGEVVPEYGLATIRELIEGPYRIICRLHPDRVEVLAVIHGARLLPTDLPR